MLKKNQQQEIRDCGNLINRIDEKINHLQILSSVPNEIKSISETVFVSTKEKSNRKKFNGCLKNKDDYGKLKRDKEKNRSKVQISGDIRSALFIQNQEGSQISVTTSTKKRSNTGTLNSSSSQKKNSDSSSVKNNLTNSILYKNSEKSKSISNIDISNCTENYNENAQSESVYTAKHLGQSFSKQIDLGSTITNKMGVNFEKNNGTSNFNMNSNIFLNDSEARKKFDALRTEESNHLLNRNNFISIEETNSFANSVDLSKINFLDEILAKKMETMKKEICSELEDFVIDKFNSSIIAPIFEDIEFVKDRINKFSSECSKNFKEVNRLFSIKSEADSILIDLKEDLKIFREFININQS